MRGRGSWVSATAGVLVIGLAGCSAAATSSGTASSAGGASASKSASAAAQTGGAAAVSPGHDTPQDAADGLIQAELSGNFQLACSYFVPAQQATCRGLHISLPKGHIFVAGAVTSDDLALVEITGHVCTSGNGCQTNTDPSLGMPNGSETFKHAFDNALNSGEFSPVPCKKVDGMWYVDSAS